MRMNDQINANMQDISFLDNEKKTWIILLKQLLLNYKPKSMYCIYIAEYNFINISMQSQIQQLCEEFFINKIQFYMNVMFIHFHFFIN